MIRFRVSALSLTCFRRRCSFLAVKPLMTDLGTGMPRSRLVDSSRVVVLPSLLGVKNPAALHVFEAV
jgi:hypothetical protein